MSAPDRGDSSTAVVGGVRVEELEGGQIWRLVLATPKGNVLDGEKIGTITSVFEQAAGTRDAKAVILEGEGEHFSFGASVAEHLPGQFETMIPAFHGMFRRILDSNLVVLSAVRGQCLGGGLELAAFAHRLFASPDAKLGQPEIVLGVFAPVASVILPDRIGRARGEELCISGRVVSAAEALEMGLVDEMADDPGAAALDWARRYVLPRSASSLRLAVRAARTGWSNRFRAILHETERLYVGELMRTEDAVEGLQAFLGRRDPEWRNR